MPEEHRKIRVEEGGLRLDKYLALYQEDLSRSFVQKLIGEGRVKIEGIPVKSSYRVQKGEEIVFTIPETPSLDPCPQKIPLQIIFEDEYLIIINKQPGLVFIPLPAIPMGLWSMPF